MGDLKAKTLKGLSWSFIDNIFNSGITFFLGIVLARMIDPSEFGLLGMITVFVTLATVFVDGGFYTALVRKQVASSIDFNTVFYSNLIFGFVVYVLFYLSSPAISMFFHQPRLILISRVVGFVLIINALTIVQRAILTRNIDFKTQAKISLISSILSGAVGLYLAFHDYGVWSLIFLTLTRQLLQSVFLWTFSKWRPSLIFSIDSFNELFSFGYKVLLSELLNKLYKNIYYVIIGRFYSATQLGNYTRAEQFNSIFSNNLTAIVQKVSFPVLSSIQGDQERLRFAYRKVIKSTMLVAFVCMLGLAAIAKPLIIILIGSKWSFCIVYLQIICFSGMLYPLNAINMNMLDIKGRSDLFLKIEVVTKFLSIPHIVLGIFYGIEYMLLGGVFTTIVIFFFKSYYSKAMINYSSFDQIIDLLPSFIISVIVASFMYSISFFNIDNIYMIVIQIILGGLLYIVMLEIFKLSEYLEIKKSVYTLFSSSFMSD